MKHEFGIERQPHFKEPWPDALKFFSWIEYAVTLPYPTYLITTLKENGKPNAAWWSWGCFAGKGYRPGPGGQAYYSLLVAAEGGHTCDNILRTGEWCINLPSLDNDEITDAGFTVEPSRVIQAPRIAECRVNMECRLEWHKPLVEGSCHLVVVGKIVHVAMDEQACVADSRQRLANLNSMFNVMDTLDPISGETTPGGLGIVRLP
jgi:flavin reductase (DIM6/NTAB) family NADH-FMN oxidoreductase RutF